MKLNTKLANTMLDYLIDELGADKTIQAVLNAKHSHQSTPDIDYLGRVELAIAAETLERKQKAMNANCRKACVKSCMEVLHDQ